MYVLARRFYIPEKKLSETGTRNEIGRAVEPVLWL
jgi:hypothetical protein